MPPPSFTMLTAPDTQHQVQDRTTRLRQPERLALTLHFNETEGMQATSCTHPHLLFSPSHYEPKYAYPLLVWLHDAGEDERKIMRVMPAISMRNYVAVAPQGIVDGASVQEDAWDSGDVTAILRGGQLRKIVYDWPVSSEAVLQAEQRIFDCVSVAKKRCNIAPNRIFIGGFGAGGTMALRAALMNPQQFAGVISLGGAFPQGNRVLHHWSAARSLRIFLGTGQTSTVFSPASACRSLELLHTAGLSVALREYDCGQELIPAMLQDINRWMMGIVCG